MRKVGTKSNSPGPSETPLNVTNAKPDQGTSFLGIKSRDLYLGIIIAVFIAFLLAAYHFYVIIRRYLLARDVVAEVILVGPRNPKVGETITVRVHYRKEGKVLTPRESPELEQLEENTVIEPIVAANRNIFVLKENLLQTGRYEYKFSVRQSGECQIKAWFHQFNISPEMPYSLTILPGPVNSKYVDFFVLNPNILCITEAETDIFQLALKDEYENTCKPEDVRIEDLDFEVFHMGRLIRIDYQFCVRPVASQNGESFQPCVVLQLKVDQAGIYNCVLKHRDYEVRSSHGGPKILICMSTEERDNCIETLSSFSTPLAFTYTTQCKLTTPKEKTEEFYVGITPETVAFAYYSVPLRLYPDIKFLISDKLRIALNSHSERFGGEGNEIAFRIHDGLQAPINVHMSPSAARVFLAIFANHQGIVFKTRKKTFKEKHTLLKAQLSSYFFWIESEKVLKLHTRHLVASTITQLETVNGEWQVPFRIIYENEPIPKKLPPAAIGVKDWLDQLCDTLFGENGSHCLFHKLENSKLIHINATGAPREWYRLAGQILAKGIVELLLRNIVSRVSELRFSRSLLAFLLGIPVTYRCLETDEPNYYKKILRILQADMTDEHCTFTTLTSGNSEIALNLLPNGSAIKVTNTNKEQYLNLLTQYRLIHKVSTEMTEFRSGFYDVVDQSLLVDFDETDLQNLISGRSDFVLEDLKNHHRVLMEVDTGYNNPILSEDVRPSSRQIDSKKLLKWFWAALENFSDEEQSNLVFFTTRSYSIPPKGFQDLNPLFTINLTGTFEQLPKANPQTHEIVLSDHRFFDNFEKCLLLAIKPASERTLRREISHSHIEDLGVPALCSDFEQEAIETGDTSNQIARIIQYEDDPTRPNWYPVIQWIREFIGL